MHEFSLELLIPSWLQVWNFYNLHTTIYFGTDVTPLPIKLCTPYSIYHKNPTGLYSVYIYTIIIICILKNLKIFTGNKYLWKIPHPVSIHPQKSALIFHFKCLLNTRYYLFSIMCHHGHIYNFFILSMYSIDIN